MNIVIRDEVTESIIREYLEFRKCKHTLDALGPRSEEDTVSHFSLYLSSSLQTWPKSAIRTEICIRRKIEKNMGLS